MSEGATVALLAARMMPKYQLAFLKQLSTAANQFHPSDGRAANVTGLALELEATGSRTFREQSARPQRLETPPNADRGGF